MRCGAGQPAATVVAVPMPAVQRLADETPVVRKLEDRRKLADEEDAVVIYIEFAAQPEAPKPAESPAKK